VDLLVGANTGSFQSLRAQLFIFVGDQVDAEGKLVNIRTLSAKIEDSDLRIGDTTVETGLGVGLENMSVLIQLSSLRLRAGVIVMLWWRSKFDDPSRASNYSSRESTHLVLAVTITSRWAACHLE
jgi:hypothetical protein